jgi:hypothetical protein
MVKTITFPKNEYTLQECKTWIQQNDFNTFELVKQTPDNYIFLASHNVIGGSLWNELKRHYKGVQMAIKGNRSNIKPSSRKSISKNKEEVITKIEIGRRPLGTQYKTIMNTLNVVLDHKPPPIDKLFHLYLIVTLSNGNMMTIEKNEDINVITYKPSEIEEKFPIQQTMSVSIQDYLDNTKIEMGEHDFFTYDAFSLNCQDFVFRSLKANGVNVSSLMNSFIMQDVTKLVPKFGKKIAYFLTSLSNRAKTALYGEGRFKYM